MKPTEEHVKRIKKELKDAGATAYGLAKFSSKYLPNVIHPEEHVKAVVYGRYREDGGLLNFAEGMLVATERRVIFLDHKPGYTKTDEVSYDIVSGVQESSAGFTAVTLHTKICDYTLRFVNDKCANNFVKYVERRRLEELQGLNSDADSAGLQPLTTKLDERALNFLKEHDVAVLSTLDREGNISGAVVYYMVDEGNLIYILTKAGTQKAHNIFANQQVALTCYEAAKMQTVQLHGVAQIEADQSVKDRVFAALIKPRFSEAGAKMPPVTKLHEGSYMIIKIRPTWARFTDFMQAE